MQAKQDLYNRARSRAKLLADSASSKSRQAEKKAPAFKEPRSEEWEAVWCSLRRKVSDGTWAVAPLRLVIISAGSSKGLCASK